MIRDPNSLLLRPGALLYLLACVSVALLLTWTDASFAQEEDGGSVVVRVTEDGFDPGSVEVVAGESVVFENVDSEGHWPASDDHPTHEKYPAFDPKKPIQPNTSWSVTLSKPGEWEYHDHMNPTLTGKIVVKNEGTPDGFFSSIGAFFVGAYEATIAVLVGTEEGTASGSGGEARDERYEKKKDELVALMKEENPRVALDRLRQEIETDDRLSRSCHSLVHEIGREAYEKYGDVGEAMKYRDEVCNSGYLHGIIETKFVESEDVISDVQTMCDQYRNGGFLSWQCNHGLGHGVMFYTANDLPRSLEMCNTLGGSFASSNCANGVFMENFNADQKLHLSEFLKEDDPFYPCMKQAERHKTDCYIYAPTYFLSLHQDDYAAALEWCEGAEAGYEAACAYGVGTQTMKENLNDPGFVESTCMGGELDQREPCIQGMTALHISHSGSLGPARELCARLEPPNRQACYDTVEAHTSLFADSPT
ncbi:MAG: cupredoxin domain-containing protein [Rubrobacter sp.]